MIGRVLFLFSAIILALCNGSHISGPKIKTEQGKLQGTLLTSTNGRKFYAFQGIPYAQPPVGNLRFKEPELPTPWNGTWNATHPGSICLQFRRTYPPIAHVQETTLGEEDCLFINVYTPKIPTKRLSPNFDVIVYIHGGAFMYGWSHEYNPHHLMDRDIVVVTFNYRVGPLGFLSTDDDIIPGNMGLKDQTAALKWIQKNIAAFGRNPYSVTITGTSAGGASVHYHYLSPLSRDLFKRGFSQSGTALCPWVLMEKGGAKAKKLGAALGCNTENSKELLECLLQRPARQIVEQTKNFQVWKYNPFSPFAPTVEVGGANPFLSKEPVNAILDGDAQNIPWITSVTTEEGLYPSGDWVGYEEVMQILDQRFDEFAPHIFHYNFTVSENKKQETVDQIRQHYLQNRPLTKCAREIIKMTSDRLFNVEAGRAAKLQASINSAPVYFYEFGYRGRHSFSETNAGTTTNYGVCHADDSGYTILSEPMFINETWEDKAMSNLLLDIWISYAYNGNPIPPGSNLIWEPTTRNTNELKYLHIASHDKLEMRSSINFGEQEFWDSLPIEESQIKKNTPINFQNQEL